MKLGTLIKTYRTNSKLTMQEFADKAGLSKGYISMLEKNQHPQSQRQLAPSLDTYQKVATAMSISLDELISTLDGDETVRIVTTNKAMANKSEEKLLDLYRQLNESGQSKVCDYTSDLVASGNYSAGFDCQLAAHDRTDVQPSAEERQHDLDLLNSDDF